MVRRCGFAKTHIPGSSLPPSLPPYLHAESAAVEGARVFSDDVLRRSHGPDLGRGVVAVGAGEGGREGGREG